uniref:helix-turn-helix transcriptional regulator n=1 Tax=uncultured Allobacillus sp. TaxID=1638025 RepID=UPI0025960FA5|nr:helix-turn-helix transcriptional regulator [uncultured Allobacillus sp.]
MERAILIQLRKKHNLTQQELADKLDISTVYVRKLEKGTVAAGRKTMLKYEQFFKKDMKELFPDLFFNDNDNKFIKNA